MTVYGIGVIIGAGIYSILGAVVGLAGKAAWLSLLVAALPAILGALCYAELGTRFPRAGASFVFVRSAFPEWRWLARLMGLLMVCIAPATAATVALAFGGYLASLTPLPPIGGALALLILTSALNVWGLRATLRFALICTAIEVLGLLIVLAIAVFAGKFDLGLDAWAAPEVESARAFAGVMSGAALAFFVFTGFEGLASLSEETKHPERSLPIALLLSVLITTGLYVAVAVAATSLVTPEVLSASQSPLSTAVQSAGPIWSIVLGWIALFSTANTALISMVFGSRILFGMATNQEMPAGFQKVTRRHKAPWAAALAIGLSAALLLPFGSIAVVGSAAALLTLIVIGFDSLALIRLRLRDPENASLPPSRFRVPGDVLGFPVIPAVLIAVILVLLTQFERSAYTLAAAVLIIGLFVSLSRRGTSHKPIRA